MDRMISNAREIESLGKSIYRDKNGIIHIDNNIKLLNKIIDNNGNLRFVEGNLELKTVTGVTFTYGKWSLCGSHLMIVLCGTIANGTTTTTAEFAVAKVPNYIKSKIVPVFASNYIAISNDNAYADDWSSQSVQNALKTSDEGIVIQHIDSHEFTAERKFRIQYDLLIDMA